MVCCGMAQHCPRVYDHRIREQVVRTATPTYSLSMVASVPGDVLDPEIPADIAAAARDFAAVSGIDAEWLNCKTHDFVAIPGCVPEGWRTRLRVAFTGRSLHLLTLGHLDLLCTKLVALVDRGIDYQDCVALNPSLEELRAAWPFVEQYEGNADSRDKYWVPLARRQLTRLAKELGYDAVF
jgi:hypothetical protein